MTRKEIAFENFKINPITSWSQDWFLLTCGKNTPGEFNCMTVGWGSIGVMWRKPFVQVVVRPSRHTINFIDKHDTFTLTAFGSDYRDALNLCGSKSGRDLDKVAEAGLTPLPSQIIECPGFEEAELILECRKIYHDEMKPANFMDDAIEPLYNGDDYHKIYFGEILHINGIDKYQG